MPAEVTRRAMERWLLEHGFRELPGKKTSHRQYEGHRVKIALPGHGPQDLTKKHVALQGEVPNPASPPSGCYFHPRCPFVVDVCRTETPVWQEISRGHFVGCHRADELQLAGVD